MREAIDDFAGGLPGDGPQHLCQFKDHGFGNEYVARGKYAGGNTRLRRVVAQVVAREHVGINGAHASPLSAWPPRRAFP